MQASSKSLRKERIAMNKQTKRKMLELTLVWACCAAALHAQSTIDQAIVMARGGFPYTITQPGSYKLTSNLTMPTGSTNTDCIDIAADDVLLDLNGFAILGAPSCNGVTSVQSNGVTHKNITVKNGSVSGFGTGIYLLGSSG